MTDPPAQIDATTTPYALLGGRDAVILLAEAFYDAMERDEPALTKLHRQHPDGDGVHPEVRKRFALFLIGWLGGPQDYLAEHGHPRLRIRHAHVPVNVPMRDAWLRAMRAALDARGVSGDLRGFLERRFGEVADFMRNQP
jgi:hemoglobin